MAVAVAAADATALASQDTYQALTLRLGVSATVRHTAVNFSATCACTLHSARRSYESTMPPAKRLKASGARAAGAGRASESAVVPDTERPTPAEVEEEEHQFVQFARKTWLKTGKKPARSKLKNDVLKSSIWDVLEQDGFRYKSLLLLESLQTLERYAFAHFGTPESFHRD